MNHEEEEFSTSRLAPEAVRTQLARILSSPVFVNSRRISRFLRFIVERALAGEPDQLKEFTIGVEVFDRGPSFDPRLDSIVRVEARRLRGKLKEYYETDGRHDPILITFRAGSYLPVFAARERGGELRAAASDLVHKGTIAVLPFSDLSPETSALSFCQGLTEEVISAFARLTPWRVAPRRSTLAFKTHPQDVREIGRRLNAAAVLEGSVRRSGEKVRISVRLISTEDGFSLWSDTYERRMKNALVLQEEIARTIVLDLSSRFLDPLLAGGTTEKLRARGLDSRARSLLFEGTAKALARSVSYFRQAVTEDPDLASAYAGLADTHILLACLGFVPPADGIAAAKQAARKALQIDPALADAHAALGLIRASFEWDWATAERDFRRAIALDASCNKARLGLALACLAPAGKFHDAEVEIAQAQRSDPGSLVVGSALGLLHYLSREYDRAAEELTKILSLDSNLYWVHFLAGLISERRARYDAAIQTMERARQLSDSDPMAVIGLAYVLASAGRCDDARRLLELAGSCSGRPCVSSFWTALVQAALGDTDLAVQSLTEAATEPCCWLAFVNLFPPLDPLRADPRFHELIRRTGLVARSEAG